MEPFAESQLLDVRPEASFVDGHYPNAVNIPLEQLFSRVHELPSGDVAIAVIDSSEERAAQAAALLSERGLRATVADWSPNDAVARGPSRARLWRPNPFLVEALGAIRRQPHPDAPDVRRALDIACGTGRDATFLALNGYAVEAIDVLPDALQRAEDLARRAGVAIHTGVRDVEADGATLPPDRYDLITVFRFLHRPLFPLLRRAVAPGGYICCETFHVRTRETGKGPRTASYLLETGELAAAFEGFEIVLSHDAVERDGRFFSSILARRGRAVACRSVAARYMRLPCGAGGAGLTCD